MDDDDGGAGGADFGGLPVAVTEDLARDLIVGCGRDFDEDGFGFGEVAVAGEIVAEDGLEVAVGEEAAGLEFYCGGSDGGDRHYLLRSRARRHRARKSAVPGGRRWGLLRA